MQRRLYNLEYMCTINIKVDEVALRNLRPDLDSNTAIRLWVQQLVDMHLQQLQRKQNMTQEDLWHTIEQDPEFALFPSEIVDDDEEAIDLETFRADLHRMVEEVYAEP